MPNIKYIDATGNEYEVDAPVGKTVMEAAVENGIDGILAECGGACTCGTCHCYVDPEWAQKLPPADNFETDMLDYVIAPQDNSRLSCQLKITDELNGLVVRLPESQI